MAIFRIGIAAATILVSALGAHVRRRGGWEVNASFCMGGVKVPQLYLLGAQKAGTTTMARDFFDAGIESAATKPRTKELHALDDLCGLKHMRLQTVADWSGKVLSGVCPTDGSAKVIWLKQFNRTCAETEAPLSDMTPENLRMPGLPPTLGAWYGEDKSRLGFIVALREPLQRMHSGYYQSMTVNPLFANESRFATFSDYASTAMKRASRLVAASVGSKLARDYTLDQLYRSMYYLNLKPWLDHFEPRQFVLVPMMRYFDSVEARREVVATVHTRFGAAASAERVLIAGEKHARPHPSLADDVGEEMASKLQRFFEQDTLFLVKEIVGGLRRNLVLSGYKGDGSQGSVHTYLVENW